MTDKQIEVSMADGVTVICLLHDDLVDPLTIERVGEELLKLVSEDAKILINMGRVRLLSSAMLGKLIALHKQLQAVSGELKLCSLSDGLAEAFEITKFNEIIDLHHNEAEALAAFRSVSAD